MRYFVTGGTGFIGRRLVAELARRGTVHVLVRPSSRAKLAGLGGAGIDPARIVPVEGDLGAPLLGLDAAAVASLAGRIDHVFHAGAVYDLSADAAANDRANVAGTRHALDLAAAIGASAFHHVSSIASAGLYAGTFTERMFVEATGLDHPYFRSKHEAEALVRAERRVPWRVYRPAMVVGDSTTGQTDKVDGPYYFFKLLQRLRTSWPSWLPLVGLEGGWFNVVPVDFVVRALVHLAHLPGQDGECFHLTDPRPRRVGEALNVFARAAHAPQAAIRVDPKLVGQVPPDWRLLVEGFAPARRVLDEFLNALEIPREVLSLLNYPTQFDCRRTQELLAPAGIRVPPLEDYAWRLWDYWERHLDPELSLDRSLGGAVHGRVVMITGGSSGIGRATALRVAESGGRVLLVARDPAKLAAAREEIARRGEVHAYSCDLTDAAASEALVRRVLAEHGRVDVLVNNAGRSIRRGIARSYDRFHDYERLMQLNYFAAVRLTLALLPSMVERQRGHVVNVSSIGVLSNAPRFSAYVASKAALEAFTRCAAAEYKDLGVSFSVVNMPLVRTPMIAPTRIYEQMPTISAEEAAEMLAEALIHRAPRIATRLGLFAQWVHLLAPKLLELTMNTAFRMFPETAPADAAAAPTPEPTPESIAFARLMRGLHW
jgi:NAD(P)-dependent dehydrogenase (short-subunit alcohol dehydrogenase family)